MMDGDTGMQLIRETLEGTLEPRIASALVFEALAAQSSGDLPNTTSALLAFVRGPLRAAIDAKVHTQAATETVERLELVLSRILSEPPKGDSPATVELPFGLGPVRVLVISRRTSFKIALRAAFGAELAGVAHATTAAKANDIATGLVPEIYIVDAVSPVDQDPSALVPLLGRGDSTAARLVWGCEQPWGTAFTRLLREAGTAHVPIDRREGVEPLLDYVRARRSPQ